jgi:hypothetical protein
MTFLTCEIRTVDGQAVGVLVLSDKEFASGSTGYHGQGKIYMAGKRYQAQCQLVEIGGKDGGEDTA